MLRTLENDLEGIAQFINVRYANSRDLTNLQILDINGEHSDKFIEFLQKLGFKRKNDVYSINSEKVQNNVKHIEECLEEMRKEIKKGKFTLTNSSLINNQNQEQDI